MGKGFEHLLVSGLIFLELQCNHFFACRFKPMREKASVAAAVFHNELSNGLYYSKFK